MPRPTKTSNLDLTDRVKLTAGVIDRLACPAGKQQAFLRDSETPGLRVRVTTGGFKSFVYESKLDRKTMRRTIGDVKTWTIEQARIEARRLAVLLDSGHDPRTLEREQREAQAAAKAHAAVQAVTVGEVWSVYVEERGPHWGEHHRKDHARLARAGGVRSPRGTRGRGVTIAGPLHPLMAMRLQDLTAPVIEEWTSRQAKTRPTPARLAWRLLRAFLAWCAEHPDFTAVVSAQNPARTRRARDSLGKPGVKRDALMREQLPAWFAAVRRIGNPTISAYLQTLLITGARPGSVLTIRWEDINTQWRGLTIQDKIDGVRVIPLTPYVWSLLDALPRHSEWVFHSNVQKRGEPAQHITSPNSAHTKACKVAGVGRVSLHGLRRSFKSLSEWLEVPAGVVAQIQGHKPSGTAEKHYTVRPLDLLRIHHERIESWMLEQAAVPFSAHTQPTRLHIVGSPTHG